MAERTTDINSYRRNRSQRLAQEIRSTFVSDIGMINDNLAEVVITNPDGAEQIVTLKRNDSGKWDSQTFTMEEYVHHVLQQGD